jgi:hypothetical protein
MIYGLTDEHIHPPLRFSGLEDFRRVVVGSWNSADPRMIALGTQARVRIGDRLWSWAAFVNVPGLGRLCCPAFHDDVDTVDLSRGRASAKIVSRHANKALDSTT